MSIFNSRTERLAVVAGLLVLPAIGLVNRCVGYLQISRNNPQVEYVQEEPQQEPNLIAAIPDPNTPNLEQRATETSGNVEEKNPLDVDDDGTQDIDFKTNKAEKEGYIDYILKQSQDLVLRNVVVSIIESGVRQYNDAEELLMSKDGAVGIFQLTKDAIRYLNQCTGKKSDRELVRYEKEKPVYIGVLEGTYSWSRVCADPVSNMQAGIDYLKRLDQIFNCYPPEVREELTVAAYNCGFPQVKNAIKKAKESRLKNPEKIETYQTFLSQRSQTETVNHIKKYRAFKTAINSEGISIIH